MADDGHFAQAARAWCEEALARLLPDLDRGASCPAFKRTPSAEQLLRGQPKGVASQAPELHQRKIGITPFDCPRDKCSPDR
jgi:hypothetical protein